ncbi:ATP-dependent nuclease [Mesoplasma melaleucae]|uniref:ATPase AAA-type core domain-containing protein n=1 Tax=Mesoplasma melaleucae TaxID=81459 RepID=A0A2K8NVE9_9MOLU|nr:AAA family ATPase [Mesoplasma melaleucae]ATZ17812.1 hypothetical protein EMELA_v1c02390 [Mesoplasma melaleucae]
MIESITVYNYKKIQEKNFNFKRTNLLIGENNSGKSTLLQLINDMFNYFENGKLNYFSKDKEKKTRFKVKFKEQEELNLEFNEKGVLINYESDLEYLKIKKILESNNVIFIDSENIDYTNVVSKIVGSYFYKKIDEDKELNEAYEKLNKAYQNSIFDVSTNFLKEDIFLFDNKDVILKNLNLSSSSDISKSYKVVKPKIPDHESIDQMGSGTKKSIVYSLLCMQENLHKTTLIVDEIENNLSLNKVESIITKIFASKYEQIFISSHSPIVMNIIINLKFDETELIFLNDKSDSKNQELINSILLDSFSLASSFGPKYFVFVEGNEDMNIYKHILNIFCENIDENKKKKVFFIPLNGADNFERVLKRNQELLTSKIPILKILDGDKSHKKYTKPEINETVYCLKRKCIEFYLDFSKPEIEKLIKNKLKLQKAILNQTQEATNSIIDKKACSNILLDEILNDRNNQLVNEIEEIFFNFLK